MKNNTFITIITLLFCFVSCKNKDTSVAKTIQSKESITKSIQQMKSYVSIFEIPATNITRAVNFYKEILGIEIERFHFPEMEMGVFPYQNQMVTGVIIQGEGYQPSASGVTIYLNGGDNLQTIIDKVEEYGGKVMIPKTPHADENGYFAIFLDSEGNKIGLHSPN
ncbi:VOC family protein [Tenacibaculum sp. 1B UA]|uniref:VOC family protein n=1 Tax=Tenacibaculum sp. 1B UA TaxID=2922252 RepID=UPI002A2426E3|nr:VOC family protein [Tenacibaculum sp. 1B UA]MDX8553762.1 VOC family protein [Tenacibaculum sp. 1B UA]